MDFYRVRTYGQRGLYPRNAYPDWVLRRDRGSDLVCTGLILTRLPTCLPLYFFTLRYVPAKDLRQRVLQLMVSLTTVDRFPRDLHRPHSSPERHLYDLFLSRDKLVVLGVGEHRWYSVTRRTRPRRWVHAKGQVLQFYDGLQSGRCSNNSPTVSETSLDTLHSPTLLVW